MTRLTAPAEAVPSGRLKAIAPELDRLLLGASARADALFRPVDIRRETVQVPMRDGTRLATDLHLPPEAPVPAVLIRTPYGRAREKLATAVMAFACHGYAVVSQDCRGTGDSEPDHWDYYVHEREDSYDLVDWVGRQSWASDRILSCGGSYVGQTQWAMALHPRMTAIAPEVSGLGVATNTADLHMFLNAYGRTVGKGTDKARLSYAELEHDMLGETLAGGMYDAPLEPPVAEALLDRFPAAQRESLADLRAALWLTYVRLDGAGRAAFVKTALGKDQVTISEVEKLKTVFGPNVAHDAHSVPASSPAGLAQALMAPPLMITGWYDWGLNDALATWNLLQSQACSKVREGARLVIAPSAHSGPGYHEGVEAHPELAKAYRTETMAPLLLKWFAAAARPGLGTWPKVIYYLMGANEWRCATNWPPAAAKQKAFYLAQNGELRADAPDAMNGQDAYRYDPLDPTPTVGGSILSNVIRPGSVDVSLVQQRADVICYTTAPLEADLDVVGPLQMVLHASSSAVDTDFVVRLSDVHADGRAIQIQNGVLRTRYRDRSPSLMEPGSVYALTIDMWATAHRFRAGHRLRIDIASADFPRFNRNGNRGGEPGDPAIATQHIHHGPATPSRLLVSVLAEETTALHPETRTRARSRRQPDSARHGFADGGGDKIRDPA